MVAAALEGVDMKMPEWLKSLLARVTGKSVSISNERTDSNYTAVRLQLVLSRASYERLLAVKENSGARNFAQVIARALALFELLDQMHREGAVLEATKQNGDVVHVIVPPFTEAAPEPKLKPRLMLVVDNTEAGRD